MYQNMLELTKDLDQYKAISEESLHEESAFKPFLNEGVLVWA